MASEPLSPLHAIAESARHELMQCQFALDDAEAARTSRFPGSILPTTKLMKRWKLHRARRHRAAARELITHLHETLHERASLGRRNADLWGTILRGVDALLMSRWLNADALTTADLSPARATVHIMLGDLAEVVGHLHELQWPGEAPSSSSPPTSS